MITHCPYCNQQIVIIELNCRIFRCGIYKSDFTQIDPHLSKEECMRIFQRKLIYGCGNPFRIPEDDNSDTPIAVKCGYE